MPNCHGWVERRPWWQGPVKKPALQEYFGARTGLWRQNLVPQIGAADWCRKWALLHKSAEGRSSCFPGQTYPMTFVTGIPSAVKPFRTATRTWNSAS